jgi:hypothetical protein
MRDEVKNILANRQEEYGDSYYNFTAIGRIWGALLGVSDIPAYQVALMMDSLKTIRCFTNPLHQDSWNDKLGYIHHGENAAKIDKGNSNES